MTWSMILRKDEQFIPEPLWQTLDRAGCTTRSSLRRGLVGVAVQRYRALPSLREYIEVTRRRGDLK